MEEVRRVIGYLRCSTEEQADSGAGIDAQKVAIEQECLRRGWPQPGLVIDEGRSGATLDRPGLIRLIEEVDAGEVDVVVVAKLDRLSRSVVDFATLLTWFADETYCQLVVLDLAIDTSTPGGELVANVIASVAQWERRIIGARTRDGLRAIRDRGGVISRPAVADQPELADRIRRLRKDGLTMRAICDILNAEQIPTLRGASEWRPSSVAATCGYKRPPRRRRGSLPLERASSPRARSSATTAMSR